MGWRDRDYAQTDWFGGPRRYRRGPSWLIGGSIVTTLIVANVVIFVLMMFSPALEEAFYVYGALQTQAVMQGQVWRLLTAQYLHATPTHLLLNMIGLHFLGRPIEQMWSIRRFFGIYTWCGLIGNIFFTVLGSKGIIDPQMPAVGASGCIYGLLGIAAVRFPDAIIFLFIFPMRIRTAAIVLGVLAFATVRNRGANYGGEACHLAGLLFGVWWAWRGERWWNATEWRFLPRRKRQSAGARGAWWRPVERQADQADQAEIDRILKKVYDHGIHSLTESERRTLQRASDDQRRRESAVGPGGR